MPAIAGPERRQRHSTGNVLGAAKRQFQARVEPYSLPLSTTPLNDIERRGGRRRKEEHFLLTCPKISPLTKKKNKEHITLKRKAESKSRGLASCWIQRKRLTNTPFRRQACVVKWLDDQRKEVGSAQATHPRGSSAVSSGVYEQRHATQRVLPESGFEFRHA